MSRRSRHVKRVYQILVFLQHDTSFDLEGRRELSRFHSQLSVQQSEGTDFLILSEAIGESLNLLANEPLVPPEHGQGPPDSLRQP